MASKLYNGPASGRKRDFVTERLQMTYLSGRKRDFVTEHALMTYRSGH